MQLKLAFAALLLCATSLRAQTPTACDDLCTALVAHGQDSTTAPVIAVALEIAIANQNSYIARIAALEAKVAALTPLHPPPCANTSGSTVKPDVMLPLSGFAIGRGCKQRQ
jgi:hypothetical protein